MEQWEKKVLADPGAGERVAQIEHELRLAAGLTRLREDAGVSQSELARRIGVRQPRIAAIERSRNVTFDVLERYVSALGGTVEVMVVKAGKKIPLVSHSAIKRPTGATPRTHEKIAKSAMKKLSETKSSAEDRSVAARKTRAERTPKAKQASR